jgi:hypothetical protein
MTAEPKLHRIGIGMHGVKLNLACNYDKLLDYVVCLLGNETGPVWGRPDLEITGVWRTEPFDGPLAASSSFDSFGKRMRLSKDELVWFDMHRNKLQLRFRRNGTTFAFDVDYCYQPSAEKLERYPDYERRKFFGLLRYLVYFPIAWFLERTQGWRLIHASAVAAGDQAVLVAGPGGSGKTTTCVALVALAGMTFVAENLLFVDGEQIYPVSEPIRLTDESLTLLGGKPIELENLSPLIGSRKHKSLFRLPTAVATRVLRPATVFIPQFSEVGFLRRIPPAIASELLGAVNRLTLELNDYDRYTAALDLLWPQAGKAQRQVHVVNRLTASTPCYVLGIDQSAGVKPVVAQINECLGWSPEVLNRVGS